MLVPRERVDAIASGCELGLELAEELERLEPCGMGNPRSRLLVPGARLRDLRPMGEGRHLRFVGRLGRDQRARGRVRVRRAARGRGRRAGRRDVPARAQLLERRGRAAPRARARAAVRAGRDRGARRARRLPDGGARRASDLDLAAGAGRRRTRGPCSTAAATARWRCCATRSRPAGEVLAVCADAPRRLSGLQLEDRRVRADLLPRARARPADRRALRPARRARPAGGRGRQGRAATLAADLPIWRGASLSYALHSRCTSWSTVSVLRSWPSTGASGCGGG